jgi:hypothetical protein
MHHRVVLLVLVFNPFQFLVLFMFCHQNFCYHFHNWLSLLPPKILTHICAWGCSKYSIDLRFILFQSLVYKVFVLLLEKEKERTKEKNKRSSYCSNKSCCWKRKFLLLKKNKERAKKMRQVDEKWVLVLLFWVFFISWVTTFVFRLTSLSKV